ncbi:prepilin-type N-terminal cleavage/methylation domain-containing protein [Anoxybacillus geothermalis]|jgi:type II secretory pathway pseudopilin PulG|uniref:prepilin-type N-terminal cleavage/methylation domain-containing protein n=1 Tax=Geobacillus zalihae TaxID=213419 RepID=UPI0007641321|nr:prepilin-type N-terminal cleavage/methylation domain-containing protein [Geobacillus zalihae]MED0654642.1 prepilin-type N-terminal cleavage/methylation domain-containing protein [Anoxybacillus geothermalis]
MTGNNFSPSSHSEGFTLVETLLALTLLSAVAISLFYFFTNAMAYTSYNQGRTVAVNVARGVAAYMERLDFSQLKNYVTSQNEFVQLTSDDCERQEKIFPDRQLCQAQLAPTINNVHYDQGRVAVFLIPYDPAVWERLKSSPPESFPRSLRDRINEETDEIKQSDPRLGQYLLKMYVLVRWGDRIEEAEWVEGVITDETIR